MSSAEVVHVSGGSTLPSRVDLVPVPEPKRVKNLLRWDLSVAHVPELLEAGATMVLLSGDDRRSDVLADPEGNEFCAFTDDP